MPTPTATSIQTGCVRHKARLAGVPACHPGAKAEHQALRSAESSLQECFRFLPEVVRFGGGFGGGRGRAGHVNFIQVE